MELVSWVVIFSILVPYVLSIVVVISCDLWISSIGSNVFNSLPLFLLTILWDINPWFGIHSSLQNCRYGMNFIILYIILYKHLIWLVFRGSLLCLISSSSVLYKYEILYLMWPIHVVNKYCFKLTYVILNDLELPFKFQLRY